MKIIYDDIIFKLQKGGGITKYWKNLYYHLNKKNKIETSSELDTKKNNFLIQIIRYLDFKYNYNENFIFHSSYYRICKNKNAINIVTVHDFVYEFYKKGIVRYIHKLQKQRAINNAKKIICVSHNTKKDLMKFYPKIDKDKIHVVYHGVSNSFKLINNSGINSKKIIFVGNRSGYKNFKQLVEALTIIKDYSLIIVSGGKIILSEKKILKGISYIHYQNISENKLNELYNESFALVYPSLYEGFGLPIIESLKAGCPVICNEDSSTGEIGKEYVLSGKISTEFIANSIRRLENKRYRKKIVQSGIEYAKKYTWENAAKETLKIYNQVW